MMVVVVEVDSFNYLYAHCPLHFESCEHVNTFVFVVNHRWYGDIFAAAKTDWGRPCWVHWLCDRGPGKSSFLKYHHSRQFHLKQLMYQYHQYHAFFYSHPPIIFVLTKHSQVCCCWQIKDVFDNLWVIFNRHSSSTYRVGVWQQYMNDY